MKFEDVKIGEMYRFQHLVSDEIATVVVVSREDQGPAELIGFADRLLFGEDMIRFQKVETGVYGLAYAKELSPLV